MVSKNNLNLLLILFRNVQDSDIGQYVCEAEHKGGVSSANGFVVIHGEIAFYFHNYNPSVFPFVHN